MTSNTMYDTPIRKGIVQRLQYGEKNVSEMADNLPTVKGNVHYHLQQLEDQGTVVKVEREYWLKKDVRRKQRKVERRFKQFRDKLKRQLAYRPNLGAFWKRYKEYQQQKQRFEQMGFNVPTFKPTDIVKAKRDTVMRVLRRHGNAQHRKFEQIQEYKKIKDWTERIFDINLDEKYSKIHTGNPALTSRLEAAFG